MREPGPLNRQMVLAEEASRITLQLSSALGLLLIRNLGFVRPAGVCGVDMQLQFPKPEFSSGKIFRSSLKERYAGFEVQIMTPYGVHIYSGDATSKQPVTERFDFSHEDYRRLTAGDTQNANMLMPESTAVKQTALAGHAEAADLVEYLQGGHPIIVSG